jgi:hypothetical protein
MLPKETSDSIDAFVCAFDAKSSADAAFAMVLKKIHLEQMKASLGWGSADITKIGKEISAYLTRKAQYIWQKAQDVVMASGVECYPSLKIDLKLCIAGYFNADLQAAENFMDRVERESRSGPRYTLLTREAFKAILAEINAEVDLFCMRYATDEKRQGASAALIVNQHGDNARVNYNSIDCSRNETLKTP